MKQTLLVAIVASMLTVAAVSFVEAASPPPSSEVAELLAATTYGSGVDFDPFDSPAEARIVSDVRVVGRLVDIVDGVQISEVNAKASDFVDPNHPLDGETSLVPLEPDPFRHIAYVIEVEEVLGQAEGTSRIPATIEVQMFSGTAFEAAELAELNSKPRVVVALDEVTVSELALDGLAPSYERDRSLPSQYFFPYVDVIWFEGDQGLLSPYIDDQTSPTEWRIARQSIDEMKDALTD